jgi:Shedu protein SduA, C-terminal
VTDTGPSVAAAVDFRRPFVGHLPGYLTASEPTAPGRPSEEVYDDLLMKQWRTLLDSPASRNERLLQGFLERHPSLLPGSNTMDGDSGHGAFPLAVVSQPKLPGLSDRHPDFMWIATDSESLYPILIEIETPHKQWFYGDRAEVHSDLAHAQGQLAEWRAWFNRGHNRTLFLEAFQVPSLLRERRLSPRFVLIHGRRANYETSPLRRAKRVELAREDERLMSFDRLTPAKWGVLYSCVRMTAAGYRVVSVPPSLTIVNDGEDYRCAMGWDDALDTCPDMPAARRDYLKKEIRNLIDNPDAYVEMIGKLAVRRPQWL